MSISWSDKCVAWIITCGLSISCLRSPICKCRKMFWFSKMAYLSLNSTWLGGGGFSMCILRSLSVEPGPLISICFLKRVELPKAIKPTQLGTKVLRTYCERGIILASEWHRILAERRIEPTSADPDVPSIYFHTAAHWAQMVVCSSNFIITFDLRVSCQLEITESYGALLFCCASC